MPETWGAVVDIVQVWGLTAGRVLLIYFVIVSLFRVVGARTIGQLSRFDFVTVLLVSSAVQNTLVSDDTIGSAVVATITLLVANTLMVRVPWLHRLLSPGRVRLVSDGELQVQSMRAEGITHDLLWSHLRQSGVHDLQEVQGAWLEETGRISVQMRDRDDPQADSVTGLPQHWAMEPHLARLGENVLLILVDVDRMSSINRDLGFQVGNDALRRYAGALRARLRPEDRVFRYSEDRFVILLETHPSNAEPVLRRLREALNRDPVILPEQGVTVTATLCAMKYSPETGLDDAFTQGKLEIREIKAQQRIPHSGAGA